MPAGAFWSVWIFFFFFLTSHPAFYKIWYSNYLSSLHVNINSLTHSLADLMNLCRVLSHLWFTLVGFILWAVFCNPFAHTSSSHHKTIMEGQHKKYRHKTYQEQGNSWVFYRRKRKGKLRNIFAWLYLESVLDWKPCRIFMKASPAC